MNVKISERGGVGVSQQDNETITERQHTGRTGRKKLNFQKRMTGSPCLQHQVVFTQDKAIRQLDHWTHQSYGCFLIFFYTILLQNV
jgi:hypothetical protein